MNYVDPSGHNPIAVPVAIASGIKAFIASVSVTSLLPVVAIGIGTFLAIKGYAKLKPKIKKEVQKLIVKVTNKILSVSSKRAEYIESLAIAVARAKVAKKTGKDENHHIVLKTSKYTKEARAKMGKFGVGINSKPNMIYLDYRFHRRVHRKAYGTTVNSYIKNASTKQKLLTRLGYLKTTLKAANSIIKNA